MDAPSWAFAGGFAGAAFGLPLGFMLIEVVKLIVSRRGARNEAQTSMLEWALQQRGVKVLRETQVAAAWVRTYDLRSLHPVDHDDDGDEVELLFDPSSLPGCFCTQVVGWREDVPPAPAILESSAVENHRAAVLAIRRSLGLSPIPLGKSRP